MTQRTLAALAGALSGLVSVLSVAISGQFLGASTTFVRTAGMVEKVIAPEHVSQLDYFIKAVPKVDWQGMFVVGIFIGALIAAVTSGSFRWQALPDMWQERFGSDSRGKRALFAFDLEMAKLSIKTTILGGNIIGGLIFGLGWGASGLLCPGTSAGALARAAGMRSGGFWGCCAVRRFLPRVTRG